MAIETVDQTRERELARRDDVPVGSAAHGCDAFVLWSLDERGQRLNVVDLVVSREAAERAGTTLAFPTSVERRQLVAV